MKRRQWLTTSALGAAAIGMHRPLLASSDTKASGASGLRILILGGTGFIGPHQVRYALSRGHRITVFNRGKRAKPGDWPAGVEELVGDRNTGDLKSLTDREWDVCIDNPTTLPFWVRDAGKVLKGKVKQYIFVSTISVYAGTAEPNDEESALAQYTGKDALAETMESFRADVANLYGPLKATAESTVRQWFGEATTIVRPGLIVGPGDETDRFSYWPRRLREGGEVLAPSLGADPVQIIDARDLAEFMIRLAETGTIGTFNATGPDYELSMAAMLYGVRACTRAGAKLTFVPAEFLAEQQVQPWSDMPVWIPDDAENGGFSRTSIARALKAGLAFRSLADTTRDTLAWFDGLPPERQKEWRAGIKREREAEVLAAWHKKT